MKNTKMLKKNYEFKKVLTKGNCYFGKFIKVFILTNKKQTKYLGIAVSKKYGKANKRNRIKRLIRENYIFFEDKIKKNVDIVFLVNRNTNIEDINYQSIREDMSNIFNKTDIMVL